MELTVIVPDGIVSGVFEPEGLVRATLRRPGEDAQSVEVAADRDGIFQFTCELFRCRELRPGDAVLVEAGRRETVVGPLGDLDWDVDLGKNEVHGSLEAPKLSNPTEVQCQVWADPGPPPVTRTADPRGGAFVCDFDDVGWALKGSQTLAIGYRGPSGHRVFYKIR
jgi:hypothetical protein